MTLRNGLGLTSFIARTQGGGYLGRNMVRLIACLAAALALFFSPIVMTGGGGMAAAHAPSASAAVADGHCSGQEAPADDRHPDISGSCTSSCAAFAPAFLRLGEEARVSRTTPPLARHQLLIGIHPEGETPPPRNSPEI